MVFVTYEMNRRRYVEAIKDLQALLDEQEEMFLRTQPKSMGYDQDKVINGNQKNAIEEYVIQKEKMEARIKEAKKILADRKEFLGVLEQSLRESNDIKDRIYTYRYLDHFRIRKIKKLTFYSEAQIYRILDSIKEAINGE